MLRRFSGIVPSLWSRAMSGAHFSVANANFSFDRAGIG